MNTGPAEAFPVGEHLLEELDARGWSQAEFAEIIGRPAQVVSEIISGKKEITRESAAQISAALGTSPEYWLRYQDQYHLWRQEQDEGARRKLDDVRLRARLTELAPLAVLRKRGIVTATTLGGQADQLCRLLNIDHIGEQPKLPMAARRSNLGDQASSTQLTWLACVRRQAESQTVSVYSPIRLRGLAERLSRDLQNPQAFADLPGRFADVGVRLVYVEAFPSSKIDGAAFSMGGTPVIGISGRGQRLDKVLFTILHEVAHVVLDHITDTVILDEENGNGRHQEKDANELAAKWVLPSPIPAIPERVGRTWLTAVAKKLGVHPIIIVGRLQNDGLLNWRSALAKNAPTVTSYLQDWENR
ncbi:Putative HTH-type transcriptional regulator [Frankia alni ACN14a]|uniref:HTH-type transcriptional regulator n=1 Tax=Frankia alni (strain DSM 45986 / CECT 9034 / ACN14a) TaxID=326424 RepID=Q0RFW2_FRAAA|nr:Putative HTH-type transcriptional regulator [Frankia alni ACN14a]